MPSSPVGPLFDLWSRAMILRTPYRLAFVTAISALLIGCSGSSAPSVTSASTTTSVYPAAYKAAPWAANVTVTYPSACTLSLSSNGIPNFHNAYYLAPVTGNGTVVATTPVSHLQLGVIPYTALTLKPASATLNICPTPAATTTATTGGAIGFLLSGVAIFNSYEATQTPALADNVSYTFTDPSGVSQTASFLDSCASHAAPGMGGNNAATWHYHGLPTCVTALVDTAAGPSHLIGFALDGFPIYGGRDVNGAVISLSQLDACNGITSPTPEFPAGAYHYVLPIGVTGAQSSIGCYRGTVSATVAATAKRLACKMPGMAAGL